MPFLRPARRYPSNLVALATVAAALAAAPKASAITWYWDGGRSTYFNHPNWNGGLQIIPSTNAILNFGRDSDGNARLDDDGYLFNENPIFLVGHMDFINQDWLVEGGRLNFDNYRSISVRGKQNGAGARVEIRNDVKITGDLSGGVFNAFVDRGSELVLSGSVDGNGGFKTTGEGTVILAGGHSVRGIDVNGGRLIDYAPSGNYNNYNGALEFDVDIDGEVDGRIIGAGSFTKSGTGSLTLSGDASYTGMTTVEGGRLIMNTPWFSQSYLLTGGDLEFASSESRVYAGQIAGYGSFTKSGTGSLTLSNGGNDIYGGIFVNGGRLIETVPTNTSHLVASGAALQFNVASDRFFLADISGGGSFAKDGAGTLYLTGANAYTGGTTVYNGRLVDANPHGDYTVHGTLEFDVTGNRTHSGAITGNGSFVKSGDGALTLARANAYTGGTTVSGGRLIDLNPHGNYVTNADLEFRNASERYFWTLADGVPTPNWISGTGDFTKSGAGDLIMIAPNGYAGSTTINGGAIVAIGDNVLPTSTDLTVNVGGTYLLGGNRRQTVASLSGAGALSLGGNTVFTVDGPSSTTFAGTISGSGAFAKSGAGTLTLSGANTYTGGTTVNGGRLVDLSPHGDYVTNATLEFAKAADSTFGGIVEGSGAFVKSGAGTLTLTGSIKQGVKTQIAGGTLKVAGTVYDDVVGASGTTLQFDDPSNFTYMAKYSGAGALLKTGRGDLTMANAPTNAGGVRVSGGNLGVRGAGAFGGGLVVDAGAGFGNASTGLLTINGASVNAGEISTTLGSTTVFTGPVSGAGDFLGRGTVDFRGGYSPGASPASVEFQGDLKLSSTLTMELGGTTLGTGYDHLNVLGTATLGGALNVISFNGFSASLGQSFDLFDFKSSNGQFSAINLPTLSGGLRWNTSRLYLDGSIQAVPEPASLLVLGLGGLAFLRRKR